MATSGWAAPAPSAGRDVVCDAGPSQLGVATGRPGCATRGVPGTSEAAGRLPRRGRARRARRNPFPPRFPPRSSLPPSPSTTFAPCVSRPASRSTILKLVYPLTSDAPPNSDQEAAIKAGAPYATPSLPTAECCAAAKSALDTNCQCDSNLPALASTLGIESSEAGLQGAIHLCAQICDLGTVSC